MKPIFNKMDESRDGSINKDDLLKNLQIDEKLMERISINGNEIDFNQFFAAA